MKIQLILTPRLEMQNTGGVDYLYPPLGILYIASYIRSKCKDVELKITDGFLVGEKKTLAEVSKYHPDAIGVSFTTPAAEGAYRLINKIRSSHPNVVIISGGPHPTAMPEDVLNRSSTDYVIIGEGEDTFYNLISSQFSKKTYGIAYKENDKIIINPPNPLIRNIDEIPFPARDLIDLKKYTGYYVCKGKPETDIVSSRGCPYNCVFCSNPVWKVQKPYLRLRSPKNIVDEVEHLVNEYGIREYFDRCDEFNASKEWAIKVCDELISRKLNVSWKVQVRVDNLNEELVARMAEAGCWLVFLGIESGNQETLDGIRKRITLDQITNACKLFRKYNIKTFALLMAFNIWEENGELKFEDYSKTKNTLNFAKQMMDDGLLNYLTWSLTTPFPGSELYDIAIRHKLIPEDVLYHWDKLNSVWNFTMSLPGVSSDEWMEIKNAGAKLQAKRIIFERDINLSTAKLFIQRGINMVKLEIGRFVKNLK